MSAQVKAPWEGLGFKDLGAYIGTKRDELNKFFTDHTKEGQLVMTDDEVKQVRERNDDLGRASKSWEEKRELDEVFQKNSAELERLASTGVNRIPHPSGGDGASQERQSKSVGQLFTESKSYLEQKGNTRPDIKVDIEGVTLKSIFGQKVLTNSTGFPPPISRDIRVVPYANRRPVIADLIPQFDTTFSSIPYVEETTFTNNAAGVAEGGTKPTSVLGLTRRNVPVEVIAHLIGVTEQQLEDVPQVRALIDDRLTFMLELAEENGLLNGNGTSPQLVGFYNKSGIQNQAVGADPLPSAIYKAMTLVRTVGFAEPTGVVMHPTDWQDIRLLQTTIGTYLFGDPDQAGPERIWGLPVIATVAATAGTKLTGDFRLYSQIARRMGMRVETGWVNDDFAKNQLTLRAEERIALLIYRAAAFCTITT